MRGPLYEKVEFCRSEETLWGKLQSGRWDWIGVHPKGQFILGRPRRFGEGTAIPTPGFERTDPEGNTGRHGVVIRQWTGWPGSPPGFLWSATATEARAEFEREVAHFEAPDRGPTLAKIILIEDGFPADERFVARTPPTNVQ